MNINPMQPRRIKPFKGKMRGSKMASTKTGSDGGLVDSFLTNIRDSCKADFNWRFASFFAGELSILVLATFFRAEALAKTNSNAKRHSCGDDLLNRISKSCDTGPAQQTPTMKRFCAVAGGRATDH